MKVKYVDTPQGAKEAATASGSAQSFTHFPQVTRGDAQAAYATLEPFGWPLDGSRQLLPDSPCLSYWSESGDSGRLTLRFSQTFSATAVTVVFSPATGEWCQQLEIAWYRGNELLARQLYSPTAATFVAERAVEHFDRLEIALSRPNYPGNFPKVQQVSLGKELWFDRSQLSAVRLINEIDPTLSRLTEDTLTFSLQNVTQPLLPQKNQKLELYRDGELVAAQYLESASREGVGSYRFSCRSAIGLLEEEFLGGMYENAPANGVIAEILQGFAYEILDLEDGLLTGYLPISTRREALQQAAFALGAVVSTQGDGVIRIQPQRRILADPFPARDIFRGSRITTQPVVSRVEVIAHRYTPGNQVEVLLQNEPVQGENVLFSFSQPHHSYQIQGGSLVESGVNYVRISAQGPVTLTAMGYVHTKTTHGQDGNAEQGRTISVDSATLVHSGNVRRVLDRLCATATLRQTLTQEVVVRGQKVGQTVTSQSPWGTLLSGYLTAMDRDLSGNTASVTVVGGEQTGECFPYAGSLYSGDKEVLTWI